MEHSIPLFSVGHIDKHREWYCGLMRGMAQTRHMLAMEALRESGIQVSDETLGHFRLENFYLDLCLSAERP